MIQQGLLNPEIASLIRRVRHTNTLVIADAAFPSWKGLETVDISLTHNIPTILDVVRAVLPNYQIGAAWMASEFLEHNTVELKEAFAAAVEPVSIQHEPHIQFKKRVPEATGLIRTSDTTMYGNLILESA